jgi:hypothetical protein
MEKQCFKQIKEAIANWSTADVRTVPGVMYQIRCGNDENDSNIEYQINWFVDCTETFIHSHRNSFDTLCLEGEYFEKVWKVIDDNSGAVTYRFYGKSGGAFDPPEVVPGTLCHVSSRHHFPGNQMHVDTEHFHSVSPGEGSDGQVVTFLKKRKHSSILGMFALSSSPTIVGSTDEIRPATEDERQNMYNKLQQILLTRYGHENEQLYKNNGRTQSY